MAKAQGKPDIFYFFKYQLAFGPDGIGDLKSNGIGANVYCC